MCFSMEIIIFLRRNNIWTISSGDIGPAVVVAGGIISRFFFKFELEFYEKLGPNTRV